MIGFLGPLLTDGPRVMTADAAVLTAWVDDGTRQDVARRPRPGFPQTLDRGPHVLSNASAGKALRLPDWESGRRLAAGGDTSQRPLESYGCAPRR